MLERVNVFMPSFELVSGICNTYLNCVCSPELLASKSDYDRQCVAMHLDNLDHLTLLQYIFDSVVNNSEDAVQHAMRHLMGIGLTDLQAHAVFNTGYGLMHALYMDILHPIISAYGPVTNMTCAPYDDSAFSVILSRESNNHAGLPLLECRPETIGG